MTGPVAGIRRRRTVAGRRETTHLPPDRDFYGQTLVIFVVVLPIALICSLFGGRGKGE